MKNTAILSTAAAVAMLAALAGCNPTGSTTQNIPMISKITEKGPNGTYVTEVTYKPNSTETLKEVKTLDGVPVYDKTDFMWESSTTHKYLQTNYNGSEATYQKVLSTIGYYNYVTKVEIFDLASPTDATGTLVESTETKYVDGTTNISEIVQKKNGVEVSRKYDYDYAYFSPSYSTTNPYFTYKQSVNGGAPTVMCYYATKLMYDYSVQRDTVVEYEVYKNWVDTSNKGTLVESQTGYTSTNTSLTITIKRLNETTGTMESTDVTTDYVTVTVVN